MPQFYEVRRFILRDDVIDGCILVNSEGQEGDSGNLQAIFVLQAGVDFLV